LERFISVVPFEEEKENFLYLAHMGDEAKKTGMELVRFLRQKGIECLIEYKERSLKNQISRANKLGAKWVLIVGEEEVKKGRYQLKNMVTGLQEEITKEEMLHFDFF
ncbi:MAG: His/Gly/Thr/Pro-type tRNA ligase C-terminal domain-containing protein, partial [Acidobacteriota bacterium]|nr:His/Gly/Thr/Pro-type tRNA ligase C-terminal domain-containing protein [Acidobacteriota bacterium]